MERNDREFDNVGESKVIDKISKINCEIDAFNFI